MTVMDTSLFSLNRGLCIFQSFLGHLIYKRVYVALVKYILLVNFFLDLSAANVFFLKALWVLPNYIIYT